MRYVKDNFLPGRQFENLEDLNRQALYWCRQADGKIHHTTRPKEEMREAEEWRFGAPFPLLAGISSTW